MNILPNLLLNIIHIEDFQGLITSHIYVEFFRMISKVARMLQRDIEGGKKQHKAMNDNLVQLVRAARVSYNREYTLIARNNCFVHKIS